jgi:micrococcal nuclease
MPRRALPWLILVAALLVYPGGVLTRGGGSPGALGPGMTLHGRVVKITDGDTIHVALAGGAEEKVRYIGMDTPETHKPGVPIQCYGIKASERNATLISGREVELKVGAEARDRYGRLLAYVYREPDGLFVNAALVRDGFARTLTIPPNDRYAGEFARLAAQARSKDEGLWGAC